MNSARNVCAVAAALLLLAFPVFAGSISLSATDCAQPLTVDPWSGAPVSLPCSVTGTASEPPPGNFTTYTLSTVSGAEQTTLTGHIEFDTPRMSAFLSVPVTVHNAFAETFSNIAGVPLVVGIVYDFSVNIAPSVAELSPSTNEIQAVFSPVGPGCHFMFLQQSAGLHSGTCAVVVNVAAGGSLPLTTDMGLYGFRFGPSSTYGGPYHATVDALLRASADVTDLAGHPLSTAVLSSPMGILLPQAVPEPSSWLLLIGAALALAGCRRARAVR